jgi:hypothetical protein
MISEFSPMKHQPAHREAPAVLADDGQIILPPSSSPVASARDRPRSGCRRRRDCRADDGRHGSAVQLLANSRSLGWSAVEREIAAVDHEIGRVASICC